MVKFKVAVEMQDGVHRRCGMMGMAAEEAQDSYSILLRLSVVKYMVRYTETTVVVDTRSTMTVAEDIVGLMKTVMVEMW